MGRGREVAPRQRRSPVEEMKEMSLDDNPKLRRGSKILMTTIDGKRTVKTWYVIEVLRDKRWLPVGDDDGMFKFATANEADAKLVELREE